MLFRYRPIFEIFSEKTRFPRFPPIVPLKIDDYDNYLIQYNDNLDTNTRFPRSAPSATLKINDTTMAIWYDIMITQILTTFFRYRPIFEIFSEKIRFPRSTPIVLLKIDDTTMTI